MRASYRARRWIAVTRHALSRQTDLGTLMVMQLVVAAFMAFLLYCSHFVR